MRKIYLFLLSSLTLAAAETVKIGVNIGLTGRGEDSDTQEVQSALLMEEKQMNSRPNAPYHYKLVFEDNKFTPMGSVMAARKMLDWDKVDVFLTLYDYAMAPVAPIAREAKIASVGYAWGVDKADAQYNFVFGCSEIAQARIIYAGLKRSPEMPTMIVGCLQSSVPNFVKEMQRLAKSDGKPPFKVIYFNPGEIEFRTMIMKIKGSGAKRLILLAWDGELNKFLYQMKQQPDFKPELWGFAFGFRYASERSMLAGSVITANSPAPGEFDRMFESYAHKHPADNTVFAYDTLKLIVQTLEEAPSSKAPLKERIVEALRERKTFHGYTGNYVQEKGVFDVPPLLLRLTATGEEPFER